MVEISRAIIAAAGPVAGSLVGAAIDRGVIDDVDQPISELLGPRMPQNVDARVATITVGQLLSMQSGLERTSGANYGSWVASRDWVANALQRPIVAEPGTRMLYSTGNSHVLSAILTRASGRSTLALTPHTTTTTVKTVMATTPINTQRMRVAKEVKANCWTCGSLALCTMVAP